MKYNITSIILGNNNDNLFGSVNDAILIYNLFYIFYLNNPNWNMPNILLDHQVKLINIINSIKNINTKNNNIILIYFSGHSNKNGDVQFHDMCLSNNYILDEINNNIAVPCDIFFIIDSCFSSNFIGNQECNSFDKINKIYYLVSCDKKQKSKEIIINYEPDMFKIKPLLENKTKIVIGIFTFYLYKLLKYKNIDDILEWKNIIKYDIWKMIKDNFGQTIYYIEKKSSLL
jgi:hypothetical protein